jgi:hypothetical protein
MRAWIHAPTDPCNLSTELFSMSSLTGLALLNGSERKLERLVILIYAGSPRPACIL